MKVYPEIEKPILTPLEDLCVRLETVSVYDLGCYSTPELLYKLVDKLNQEICRSNHFMEVVEQEFKEVADILDNILNTEIDAAVEERINELIADGTIEKLINQTVLKGINDRVDILEKRVLGMYNIDAVVDYGFTKEGDNSAKFKKMISELKDNTVITIPLGDYPISITDDNITLANNGYALALKTGVKNITFRGPGRLVINSSNCSKKNWLLNLIDCENIRVENLNIKGDFVSIADTTVRDSIANGLVFEKVRGFVMTGCKIEKVFAALSTTGHGSSPALTNDVAQDIIITNNIFDTYGQITTYGGGAKRVLFTNNICINPLQTAYKISSNPKIEASTENNSKQVMILDNVISWRGNFQFGLTSWSPSNHYSPCGIMSEAHTRDVIIRGNNIDMSDIKQSLTAPIQEIVGIIAFRGNENEKYQQDKILIENNTISCYDKKADISVAPYAKSIAIKGNTVKNGIGVSTFGQPLTHSNVIVQDNLITGGFGYCSLRCNIDSIVFKGNVFKGTTEPIIELSDVALQELSIIDNDLVGGKIINYATSPIDKVDICRNKLKTVNCTFNTATVVNVNDNLTSDRITPYTLKVGTDTVVNFTGNSGICAGALVLTGGKANIDIRGLDTQSANILSLTGTYVNKGFLISNGVPTFEALTGVMCVDYSTTGNILYLKTQTTGSDGWKQLSTV